MQDEMYLFTHRHRQEGQKKPTVTGWEHQPAFQIFCLEHKLFKFLCRRKALSVIHLSLQLVKGLENKSYEEGNWDCERRWETGGGKSF